MSHFSLFRFNYKLVVSHIFFANKNLSRFLTTKSWGLSLLGWWYQRALRFQCTEHVEKTGLADQVRHAPSRQWICDGRATDIETLEIHAAQLVIVPWLVKNAKKQLKIWKTNEGIPKIMGFFKGNYFWGIYVQFSGVHAGYVVYVCGWHIP